MQLKPFLLDAWLDQYEHDTEFFFSKTSSTDITISQDSTLAAACPRPKIPHELSEMLEGSAKRAHADECRWEGTSTP
jgi:hypothetical protein